MLKQKEFNIISKQAQDLFSKLELEIVEIISTRIMNTGIANNVVEHSVKMAQEMGLAYNDLIKLVSNYTNMTQQQVKQILSDAGAVSINYDDRIYKEAGKSPASFLKTRYLQNILEATARNVNFNLDNLVKTTATDATNQLYNALNKAYLETSTGLKSSSQAILDAVDSIDTPKVIYPNGRRMDMQSAVRMNIMTSVNQMCGQMQLARAEDMDTDLMELTAHKGARPTHAEWQGKIVSLSGKKGYLTLKDIGYGEVDGFKGINCRHDWRPYIEGFSKSFTDDELKAFKNDTVEYNGKKYSYYEASQKQRAYERSIRRDKVDIAKLKGILKSDNVDNVEKIKDKIGKKELLLKQHRDDLNDFCNQTGLRVDNQRLVVSKKTKF